MSKPAFTKAMLEFLTQVADRNQWRTVKYDLLVQELTSGDILFHAFDSRQSITIELQMERHESEPVYLLQTFRLKSDGDITMLNGIKFLNHIGKQLCSENDWERPLKQELYQIGKPVNLEALFREYDQLAKFYDCQPIFNLP